MDEKSTPLQQSLILQSEKLDREWQRFWDSSKNLMPGEQNCSDPLSRTKRTLSLRLVGTDDSGLSQTRTGPTLLKKRSVFILSRQHLTSACEPWDPSDVVLGLVALYESPFTTLSWWKRLKKMLTT